MGHRARIGTTDHSQGRTAKHYATTADFQRPNWDFHGSQTPRYRASCHLSGKICSRARCSLAAPTFARTRRADRRHHTTMRLIATPIAALATRTGPTARHRVRAGGVDSHPAMDIRTGSQPSDNHRPNVATNCPRLHQRSIRHMPPAARNPRRRPAARLRDTLNVRGISGAGQRSCCCWLLR